MSELSLDMNKHVAGVADRLDKAAGNRFNEKELAKIREEDKKEVAPQAPVSLESQFHTHYRIGVAAFVSLLAITTAFGALMPLAGAVAVNGTFTVQSSTKHIQHKTGGIVKEILVHDGSKVNTGDVLIKLDNTDTKAQNDSLSRQIDEGQLRLARLTAERDGTKMTPPAKFLSSPEEHTKLVKSEIDFFNARQKNQASIQKLADIRIAQLEKQVKGLEFQLGSNKRQLDINNKELAGMETLYKNQHTTLHQLSPLQQNKARFEGSNGQIESSILEIRNRINETQLQAQQSVETFRSEVLRDFNDASSRQNQLLEQFIITKTQLIRTDILSPIPGVVHELKVHTIGGVISPAETLMIIVPENEPLEIVTRLPADKIDQVKVGQEARIKLTAFERTTPEIPGNVNHVAPDVSVDSKAGNYYEVKVTVGQKPLGLTLTPGMPAEVFLQTQSRTMFSYLFKPLYEQGNRAFIER